MKDIRTFLLGGVSLLTLAFTSCSDWLDCNVDPENPS